MVLVSISNILEVINGYTRPMVEGEAVLDADMLVVVGRLVKETVQDDSHKVVALCLQSSAVFSNPHQIEVKLNLNDFEHRIQSLSCTCTAGSSEKCKHIVATLMYLNKKGSWEDLDELSATDLEQQWGKMKGDVKADFDALPLKEFCHIMKENVPIYSRCIPEVSDKLAADFASIFIEIDVQSEGFIHSKFLRSGASAKNCQDESAKKEEKGKKEAASLALSKILGSVFSSCMDKLKELTELKVGSLSPDLLQLYVKNVKIDEDKSVMICVGSVNQSEKLWFDERDWRITGSKCYGFYTYCSNKNPDWEKKLKSSYNSTFAGNEATVYGIKNEILARELYICKTEAKVIQTGLVVHPDLPWLGYSPDGIVLDEGDNPKVLLEIKCFSAGKTTKASDLCEVVSCFDKKTKILKKKHQYNGQIQLGMLLFGLTQCDFTMFSSFDDIVSIANVQFDENFAFSMVSQLTDVYFDKILPWLKENKTN